MIVSLLLVADLFPARSIAITVYVNVVDGLDPRPVIAQLQGLTDEVKAALAAPNFLLAKERLRPDWIPIWLKNPQALLDGTRMPSFWDFSDEAHPTSPSKAFDGDARRQIDALRDYLMHLELKQVPPPRTAMRDVNSHG